MVTAVGNRDNIPSTGTEYRVPNLVRDIRTSNKLTQKDLADRAGLSTLAVIRAEQYLYVDLPEALATALSEIDDVSSRSPEEMAIAYAKARNIQLSLNSERITSNPYYRSRIRAALNYAMDHSLSIFQILDDDDRRLNHPFALFRMCLFTSFELPTSQIQFCIFTGIHPTVLSKFENYESTDMPESIAAALNQILRLNPDEFATLELMCDGAMKNE